MLFNFLSFCVFFIVVTLLYFILPFRWRWKMLPVASCNLLHGIYPVNFRILDKLSDSPNPHQVAALNHLVEITSARGIHIFFIDSPMPAPIVSDSRIQALKADYRQFTTQRHLPYVDGDAIFPNTDPALFMDTNHLSSAGRDLFTHIVADILRDWLSHTSEQ